MGLCSNSVQPVSFVIRRDFQKLRVQRCWKKQGPGPKSGVSCVLLHLVKQKCKEYIHNDASA